MDGITVVVAYTIMIVGKVDDLEALAKLVAGIVLGVDILLIRFSSGWRLLLICRDANSLNACSIIIRDRVQSGMVVTVMSGKQPMQTRIYTTSS